MVKTVQVVRTPVTPDGEHPGIDAYRCHGGGDAPNLVGLSHRCRKYALVGVHLPVADMWLFFDQEVIVKVEVV